MMFEWKAEKIGACDGCEHSKPIMNCAELGNLCQDCFDQSELGEEEPETITIDGDGDGWG